MYAGAFVVSLCMFEIMRILSCLVNDWLRMKP